MASNSGDSRMTLEAYMDQFSPETAIGDHLDRFATLAGVINREQYGDDPDNKPNDHCVWRDIGYMYEMWRWVETDEHLRKRYKEKIKNESI